MEMQTKIPVGFAVYISVKARAWVCLSVTPMLPSGEPVNLSNWLESIKGDGFFCNFWEK